MNYKDQVYIIKVCSLKHALSTKFCNIYATVFIKHMLSARHCAKQLYTFSTHSRCLNAAYNMMEDIQLNQSSHSHCVKGCRYTHRYRISFILQEERKCPQNHVRWVECSLWQLLTTHLKSIMVSVLGLRVKKTRVCLEEGVEKD